LQVVLMSVPSRQELGWERHSKTDQFFRVDSDPKSRGLIQLGHRRRRKNGNMEMVVDEEIDLYDGVAVVVPAGRWHNVINESGKYRLNFYTIYAPPHHAANRVDRTKADERKKK